MTQDFGALPESGTFLDSNKSAPALRPRNVSLPEFFSATITHAEMGALLPAGVVLAGLGVSSEDVGSVSVSVPAAASYGLPVWDAVESVKKSPTWENKDFWQWATRYLHAYHSRSCSPDEQPLFALVTEVFAAYALDVNFNFAKGGAARLQQAMRLPTDSTRYATLDLLMKLLADRAPAVANSDKPSATPKPSQLNHPATGTAIVTENSAGQATSPGGAPSLQELREMIDALLASAAGKEQQQLPGISAQIVTGSDSGVKLQRKFAHPVVIGYRGVALLPDKKGNAPSELIPLPVDDFTPFEHTPRTSSIPNPNFP
uniref:hypothetical protein n=1 Tax=Cupriavidus gilardii TaxID=82541 RepID=UPI00247B2CF6|nr:hypothetical protein [Cupriavidus gilardii]